MAGGEHGPIAAAMMGEERLGVILKSTAALAERFAGAKNRR